MNRPRRFAVLAAFCGTAALAGWIGAERARLGSPGPQNARPPIEVSRATSVIVGAGPVDPAPATAPAEYGVAAAGTASGSAALSDPPAMPQLATPPVRLAATGPTGPAQNTAMPPVSSEAIDGCPEPDVCVDQYLWSVYERTPKIDAVKAEERIKVKFKNKGKTRTVVKNPDEVRY